MHGRGSVLVDTSKISFIYSDNIVKCDGTVFVDMIIDGQKVNYSLTKDELENLMSEKEQAIKPDHSMTFAMINGLRCELALNPNDEVEVLGMRVGEYSLINVDFKINGRLLSSYPLAQEEYNEVLRWVST